MNVKSSTNDISIKFYNIIRLTQRCIVKSLLSRGMYAELMVELNYVSLHHINESIDNTNINVCNYLLPLSVEVHYLLKFITAAIV